MADLQLDNMEYSSDANAQAAYVSNSVSRSNADIDDEDMVDITDWTDSDSGTGNSYQATFDGKSCMELASGGTTGGIAYRYKDVGTFGTRTVFSFSSYLDAIGTLIQEDYLEFSAYDGTTHLNISLATDGLFIYDGVTSNEVGTNLVVQDVWQEWTFDVDWTAKTVDVYLNGVLKASNVDCSYTDGTTNGAVRFIQYGINTVSRISYIDWFKAGSDSTSFLQSYSESTIKTQGSYSLKCIAAITNSLNNKLTKTLSPVSNLTGVKNLKFDMRASRTGANVKLGLHNNCLYSNADIDNEDMADITSWTNNDSGGGESSQVTFDGKSCMKLTGGVSIGGQGRREKDVGTFGTRTVFTLNTYVTASGTTGDGDYAESLFYNGTTLCVVAFSSTGLYSHNGANWVQVGTNLVVQGTWQEWTFDVDWTAQTLNIYLDGVLKATAVDCSFAVAGTNGTVIFKANYNTTTSPTFYIDNFKAGSTFNTVTTELTPTITTADTFQTVNWDLSSVTDANKDAIDQIIITIVNADAANTFYLDYAEIAQAIDVFGIIG